jgi:DNA-binding transcriptional MerR regulator
MRQNSKVEGTKIAQAAKDLNVTSVTIRRYLIEFNIPTTSDENGIKVLPPQAMSELQEVRRLKEEGLTNPKVLEFLEELRSKDGDEGTKVEKPRAKKISKPVEKEVVKDDDEEEEEVAPAAPPKKAVEAKTADKRKPARRVVKEKEEAEPAETVEADTVDADAADAAEQSEAADADEGQGEDNGLDASGEPRAKHSLTCQTCGKVFEHMNPRLRDCLDCYRTKRKERRRGGSERHKNVIQHPLAQQAASKAPVAQNNAAQAREPREIREPREPREPRESREGREHREPREREPREREPREREFAETAAVPSPVVPVPYQAPVIQRGQVRNYRKAIEETRQITGSLKRRLERPDLPEGERRWLEQIYAYQLILHQGWRHLSEYKSATVSQGRSNIDE